MSRDGKHRRPPWRKQEKDTAAAFAGRTTPASGAGWVRKADVRSADFLIEAKFTEAGSYRLTLEVLHTLEKQALLESRCPVLSLRMGGRDWVVLSQEDFLVMTMRAADNPPPQSTEED